MQELKCVLMEMGRRAKDAGRVLAGASATAKKQACLAMASRLLASEGRVLDANSQDVKSARAAGMPNVLIDRLTLNPERLREMVAGLREVAAQPDPIGEIEGLVRRPNGLLVGRMRVPLGVVGMIYEARPNVTVDAAGLCLKSGNAVILRGGSEALRSNECLVGVLRGALLEGGLPEDLVQLVPTSDRGAVPIMGRMSGLIDVIIARGGEQLMAALEGATVPLFRHGKGVCHVYVDASANLEMAEEIVVNAKCQRPGVCNALETLLVNERVAEEFVPRIGERLATAGVEIRGDETVCRHLPAARPATEEDWAAEYLALILAIKVVPDFETAVDHIYRYGSGHSEAIVTSDYHAALRFQREVDASAVLVNASTRFNDGGQLGLGAEIGISTQKLHARGPMGAREMTTEKFIVFGEGQVRS